MVVPAGGVYYTVEALENARRWRKEQTTREGRRERKRLVRGTLGPSYFFVISDEQYQDITAETAARLIYLASFIGFEDRRLWRTERSTIKKSDLSSILGVSTATAWRFWDAVSGKYLTTDKSGSLVLLGDYFWRGCLREKHTSHDYQLIFVESIRDLYKRTPAKQHRKLGFVFQMLPYVNVEFNVLCNNPRERDLNKIELMSLDDFCTAVGCAPAKRSVLMKDYLAITLDVDGAPERFCSIVSDGVHLSQASIFINPRIMYRGENPANVELLGKFHAFCEGEERGLNVPQST